MVAKRFAQRIGTAIGLAAVLGTGIGRLEAQTNAAVLLVLDKDALDYGPPPHLIPLDGVESLNSKIGLRDELPYFSGHVEQTVILPSGPGGNPGWFALRAVPQGWESAEVDGLRNFALSGPGLGSPDDSGDRETLLRDVPGVVVLGAAGLGQLVGKDVCAIVYAGDIHVSPSTSLTGENFGVIGFKVLTLLSGASDAYPNVEVQVLDGHEICAGTLVPFAQAPIE